MAISKTAAQILTAAQTLAAVASSPKAGGNKAGKLSELRGIFSVAANAYAREASLVRDITVPASQATAAALIATLTLVDTDAFRISSTADTTNTALATAKGSAIVAGDVFNVVGAAVVFVGIAANVPATVAGLDTALAG